MTIKHKIKYTNTSNSWCFKKTLKPDIILTGLIKTSRGKAQISNVIYKKAALIQILQTQRGKMILSIPLCKYIKNLDKVETQT